MAYADFVTAMMAFFMLMWLLNATTEKQRKGIADYFSPTIPVNRISGGGDGAFNGDSVFAEESLSQSGLGATSNDSTEEKRARGETGSNPEQDSQETAAEKAAAAAEQAALEAAAQALTAKGGESMTMERLLRHVVTRITDEGLVIEIFDLPDVPLFLDETAAPSETLESLAQLLAEVAALTSNPVAVAGHVRSYPITLRENPTWDLSAERAQVMRSLLEGDGLDGRRMARISGHADRKSVTADAAAVRNNRLEVILLRTDR